MMDATAALMDAANMVAEAAPAAEPKGALNHFCQRFCKRPVTKMDIVYTSAKYGAVYQATVTLNCIEGQQFVGETATNVKEAEKNAAHQALIHLQPLHDSLPPLSANSKNKKRKQPGLDAGQSGADPALEQASKLMKVASGPMAVPGDNPALTSKVLLNTICMKLLKRPMQKGEVLYETVQTPVGFQSTVRLPCLPGELGGLTWAGEVAQQQKQAEQNAAGQALEAINANPELTAVLAQPTGGAARQAVGGELGGCQKGFKGKGKGKFGWAPRQPIPRDLPRTRVTQVAVTGEVVEWKGKYGWLRPHAEIQHPMAAKRGGKIFVGSADLVDADESQLVVGAMLQFHVYEDPTGLGAEEVKPF